MPKPVQPVLILALSPQEAAAALGLHVSHVYRALQERRLVEKAAQIARAAGCVIGSTKPNKAFN